MSKPQNKEDLLAELDESLGWRRKEIRSLLSEAKAAKPPWQNTLLRAGATLCYAHLEGFVKSTSVSYLSYISSKRLAYSEVSPIFCAMSLAEIAVRIEYDDPVIAIKDLLVRLDPSSKDRRVYIRDFETHLKTWGNLRSAILRRILRRLNLSENLFELQYKDLDSGLLDSRNNIAHGKYRFPSVDELEHWSNLTISIMEGLKTEIENAVDLESYKLAK